MGVPQIILDVLASSINGVDYNIPGDGGVECYNFLTMRQRLLDTGVFTVFACMVVIPYALRSLSLPKELEIVSLCRKKSAQGINGGRKFLLILLCVVFGIEIGFKILTETWIYLLNPCHVITVIQIYLLSSQPSRTSMAVFRVHMHLLFGPFLASVLPVLNTRFNYAELVNYWVQHILVTFVIPPYLVITGGAFTCEPINDFSWTLLAIPIFGFYMFYVLQGMAMLTLANLNGMLCPNFSDPFYGPHYRWFAILHQQIIILSFGKLYCVILQRLVVFMEWCKRILTSNTSDSNHNTINEEKMK